MDKFAKFSFEQYLESIPGVIVIDLQGMVVYLNQQCAAYLEKDRAWSVGKHILEVFPASQMLEGLSTEQSRMVFYNTAFGIGISVQTPLFFQDEKVGLMEYDVCQEPELFYKIADDYNRFLDRELKNLTRQIIKLEGTKYSIHNIAGNSRAILRLKEEIVAAAKTNSTVVVTGETGTGKELVAHAIHHLSSRRAHRMIKVNSSAFPENLVESELFGYDRGAFTGAVKEGKKGKFELAHQGTLFIDEINHLSMTVQPKLLRVLQEKEVDRIGGEQSIPVDVRIIAASNEDLQELVKKKLFREDLYYRLNVVEIRIPPLRERLEDLEDLSDSILQELRLSIGSPVTGVDKGAIELLQGYSWPGNVRELHNAIERAVNYASTPILTKKDFDLYRKDKELFVLAEERREGENLLEEVKRKAEREFICETLKKFHNNKTKTAQYLNIPRPLLYQKMKRLGILSK